MDYDPTQKNKFKPPFKEKLKKQKKLLDQGYENEESFQPLYLDIDKYYQDIINFEK